MCVCVYSRQARDILSQHNGNKDLNSPNGLHGLQCRFVKYNGGVSANQLSWLDSVLQRSDNSHEVVLVIGKFVHCGSLR